MPYLRDLQNQLRAQNQLRGQAHGLAARGRPRRCESALRNPQGRLGRPQAPLAAPGAVGFAALSPHLGQPRDASTCSVFGVGFALGVDVEQLRNHVVRHPSVQFREVHPRRPKCIKFRSRIEPRFFCFKTRSEKRMFYDHPCYDRICVIWSAPLFAATSERPRVRALLLNVRISQRARRVLTGPALTKTVHICDVWGIRDLFRMFANFSGQKFCKNYKI